MEEIRGATLQCDPDGVIGKRNPCAKTNIPPNRLGMEDLSLITKRKQQADEIRALVQLAGIVREDPPTNGRRL